MEMEFDPDYFWHYISDGPFSYLTNLSLAPTWSCPICGDVYISPTEGEALERIEGYECDGTGLVDIGWHCCNSPRCNELQSWTRCEGIVIKLGSMLKAQRKIKKGWSYLYSSGDCKNVLETYYLDHVARIFIRAETLGVIEEVKTILKKAHYRRSKVYVNRFGYHGERAIDVLLRGELDELSRKLSS